MMRRTDVRLVAVALAFMLASCNWFTQPKVNDPSGHPPDTPNRPPVSSIVLPYAAQTGQNFTVQNIATDPDGDAVTLYRFRSSAQDFTQSSKAAAMTFSTVGKHAVFVSAKDSRNAWSAEVSDTVLISESPPSGRTLFLDDGTLEPIDLGYRIGFPANGAFSIVTSGGIRRMRYDNGNKSGGYDLNSWLVVPRGTRLKLRMYFNVDADPVWLSAGSSRGYVMLHLVLTNDDHSRHGNYFVLATRDLDSDGFPGSPPRYESNFQPGRDAFVRVGNGWTTMDIDLDELARTKFNNATGFTKIWFSHIVLTYPANQPQKYRLTHELDSFEVYVPSAP